MQLLILSCSFIAVLTVQLTNAAQIDILECGVDPDVEVHTGDVPINIYPWLGILYYAYQSDMGEVRSVTTVSLIQEEFLIAPAADIAPMPKRDFRKNSRVLLGQGWVAPGFRIRNYVIHPEYGETYNTIALIQLYEAVRELWIKPLCPPPERLISPDLYVFKFKSDFENLQKEVIPVGHIPSDMCREFYVRANLHQSLMRPPQVACVATLEEQGVCVWDAGTALVTRDVWGRWQLLGLGTRGPGCGAPSRYLDMMAYMPWVTTSLEDFRRLTISKIHDQKFVLRAGSDTYQRFGACDEEEKINLIYRESIVLRTDDIQFQYLTYNMTIMQNVEYTCLTLELVNASAASEMSIQHYCRRNTDGSPCHMYKGSTFDISVYIMFSDKCTFEMFAWGFQKNMTLLDMQEWKLEEGTYYKDFEVQKEEYKGTAWMTEFGFEPVDLHQWVPDFDIWTTTEFSNVSTTSTTEMDTQQTGPENIKNPDLYKFDYMPTSPAPTSTAESATDYDKTGTKKHKKKFKLKLRPRLPQPLTTQQPSSSSSRSSKL